MKDRLGMLTNTDGQVETVRIREAVREVASGLEVEDRLSGLGHCRDGVENQNLIVYSTDNQNNNKFRQPYCSIPNQ